MADKNERVIVRNAGNGAGWIVATVLAVILVGFVYYASTGGFSDSSSVEVELNVPEEIIPNQ